MNIFVDDASPQFSWISTSPGAVGWVVDHRTGSRFPDPLTNRYSEGTFHATFTEGDRMEFRFNGTGITVYGAKRANHGVYGVTLDELEEDFYDGSSSTDDLQAILYSKLDLSSDREHIIRVVNYPSKTTARTGQSWMDIDHVVLTHQTPGTIYTTYIDDSSAVIRYDGDWTSSAAGAGGNHNLTNHMSSTTGAEMELKFNGTSIQLFGGLNNDHGSYSISLDGGRDQVYNGRNWQLLYQVPLYTASGLTEGEHTVLYKNLGVTPDSVMGFDYALVNSTIEPQGLEEGVPSNGEVVSSASFTTADASTALSPSGSATSSPSAATADDAKAGPNIAALSGGIAGGVVALAFLAVLFFWWIRRRRTRPTDHVDQYYTDGYAGSHREPPSRRIDLASPHPDPAAATAAWVRTATPGSLADRKVAAGYPHHYHSPTTGSSTLHSPLGTPGSGGLGYAPAPAPAPAYYGAPPIPSSQGSSYPGPPATTASSGSGRATHDRYPHGGSGTQLSYPEDRTNMDTDTDMGVGHNRSASAPLSASSRSRSAGGTGPFESPLSEGTDLTTVLGSSSAGGFTPLTGHSRDPSSAASEMTSYQLLQAKRAVPYGGVPSAGPEGTPLARIESGEAEGAAGPRRVGRGFAWG